MKNGWKSSTLGEVLAVLRNGVNCKQDKSGKGVKISRIESISDASFDLEKVGYAELSKRDKERFLLQTGDILFSHINSPVHVGKTALFDSSEPVYHGVNLLLMRPIEEVSSEYLNHALKYLFQTGYWRGVCKQSVNQASVNQQDISKVEFCFPPLPEQKRIVALLDEAFEGLAIAQANAEKNLQNAQALFESHLQSVFSQRGDGWVEKKLSDVCDLISGQHIDAKDYNIEGRGVGYLTGPSDFGFINPVITKWSEHPKRMAQQGDILVTVKGSGVGKINILNIQEVAISRQLMAVRAKATDVEYLYAFLSTRFDHFQSLSTGAAIPGISREDVLELLCPMPPPKEQKEIVNLIHSLATETQRLESLYAQKLAALAALKKSLLHQAFSGNL